MKWSTRNLFRMRSRGSIIMPWEAGTLFPPMTVSPNEVTSSWWPDQGLQIEHPLGSTAWCPWRRTGFGCRSWGWSSLGEERDSGWGRLLLKRLFALQLELLRLCIDWLLLEEPWLPPTALLLLPLSLDLPFRGPLSCWTAVLGKKKKVIKSFGFVYDIRQEVDVVELSGGEGTHREET